jgi:allantoicase
MICSANQKHCVSICSKEKFSLVVLLVFIDGGIALPRRDDEEEVTNHERSIETT